jgi:hypothetical protein
VIVDIVVLHIGRVGHHSPLMWLMAMSVRWAVRNAERMEIQLRGGN